MSKRRRSVLTLISRKIQGIVAGPKYQIRRRSVLNRFHEKFNLYSKIKGACQDIPYDHVEDEDGLMLQQPTRNKSSGLLTIVKIKKKACVCLKDLNQLDDYDNFV